MFVDQAAFTFDAVVLVQYYHDSAVIGTCHSFFFSFDNTTVYHNRSYYCRNYTDTVMLVHLRWSGHQYPWKWEGVGGRSTWSPSEVSFGSFLEKTRLEGDQMLYV
jgi:hypothetical protein